MNKMKMINAFNPDDLSALGAHDRDLIERRARALGAAYRLFYHLPVHIVRGEGVRLFGADGREYLDAYNNVASVGHCHPHVVEAIARQSGVLNTHTRYLHEGIVDYAERLLATLPQPGYQLMMTCTGTEANDLAYRIARTATGGTGFIVTELAYHGITDGLVALSPSLGDVTHNGRNVRLVRAPRPTHAGDTDVGARFAADVQAAIDALERDGERFAGLMVDTIFSSDGVYTEPAGFLRQAAEVVKRAGGLFIADEVQPGFGRSGDGMWGFGRHGIDPDIVTVGKPMGNGFPMAGLMGKEALLTDFGRRVRYFNTFGGNPVAAAAGMAVLDVIESEGLIDNAKRVGSLLRDGLAQLAAKHSLIGDVRGAGLFVGVELVSDRATGTPASQETASLVNRLREDGILISACGPGANVLKIRPPLCFGADHAARLIEGVDTALGRIR